MGSKAIIGLSMSHDASAALVTTEGSTVCAMGEERRTRKKNYLGFPHHALASCYAVAQEKGLEVTGVVLGSHSSPLVRLLPSALWSLEIDGMPCDPQNELSPPDSLCPACLTSCRTAQTLLASFDLA